MIIILKRLSEKDFFKGKLDVLFANEKAKYEIASHPKWAGIILYVNELSEENIITILESLNIEFYRFNEDEKLHMKKFFDFLKNNLKKYPDGILRDFLYRGGIIDTLHFEELSKLYTFIKENDKGEVNE